MDPVAVSNRNDRFHVRGGDGAMEVEHRIVHPFIMIMARR